ncbi:MAG TPA: hypothetical protein VGJ00_08205 [Rhabdochlamydiaceae bacterium]|jgi:hypothetical protein
MAQPVNGQKLHQGDWTKGAWTSKRLEENRESLVTDTIIVV